MSELLWYPGADHEWQARRPVFNVGGAVREREGEGEGSGTCPRFQADSDP
jgi:hypothetical protein